MRRQTLSFVLKSVLAAAILGYLVHVVNLREIAATAADAELQWIFAAVLLLPVNLFIEGTLWYRLTHLVLEMPRRRTSFGALLSGYALGFFTPGRLGELAGRSFYHDHPRKWELSALVLFQRMIDMLVGVVIGLFVLVAFIIFTNPGPQGLWWAMAAVGAATAPLLAYVLLRPDPSHNLLSRWVKKDRLLEPVAFLQRVEPEHVTPYLALSTLRYTVFVTQFVFLIWGFDSAGALLQTYGGASMTFYAKYMIPSVTVMDLGIREGSAVFFMGATGFSQAAAFNASLLMFFINLVLPSAAGIPFVMRLKLNAREAARKTAADMNVAG